MNLQYIYDDTTSPPTQSVLQYKVDPDTVYVSTDTEQMMVNLTITVYNPTQATVNCQNFQFGISVGTGGGQLASTSDGVQLTTDQSQWVTNAQAIRQGDLYWYTASPAQGAASEPLAASQSFVFHLESIAVNQVEGGTPFMILEVTDQDPNGVQGALSLSKEQGSLAISHFSVIPPTPVSPGTQVNISWDVMGAEYWLLYNTTLSKLLYDSRKDSPPQTSWQDTPEAWTEYELIAYAGQIFTFATAVAQVTNPRFLDNYPPTANPTAVDSGTASTISWRTADTQYVIVTADGGYTSGHIDSSSGQASWQVNPILTTDYTVTAYGADGQSGEALGVTVSVNPPQIKSFTAVPTSFNPGQAVTLMWETESAVSLVLDPGSVSFQPTETSYAVYPKGQVVYLLTAQGQGPSAKSSPVTVTQLLETFSAGEVPQALAYDGTYIWAANAYACTVTRLLAADGSNQGAFPTGNYPDALAYDGTYIWVSGGGNTVTRLLATDGSTQGNFTVGNEPTALVYDGTYIWSGNESDNSVTRLLAADGSNQGTFPAGNNPFALAYDGTYIWVVNYDANSVTRLLATDGSNRGTFGTGINPLALVYDGTYIWVANHNDNSVIRLLARDGSNHGSFPVGNGPRALAYDGTYIWVANTDDNTIARLLATDGSNLETFPVGNYPFALVYDGNYVWVANYGDNTVTRIRPLDWPSSLDNS